MDALLDRIWEQIVVAVSLAKTSLDWVLAPLDALGPALSIAVIALASVALTKLLSSRFKTQRYYRLQAEFRRWYDLRQEALKGEDRETSKRLAKNIDQAQLNKAYYDFFFEGFLNNLATRYLPFLVVLAYVNEAYRPIQLVQRFGRDHIFRLGGHSTDGVAIGAVFWFVVLVVVISLLWSTLNKRWGKNRVWMAA
jgi:hypothetical protein